MLLTKGASALEGLRYILLSLSLQNQDPLDDVSQFAKGYEDYLQCPLQVNTSPFPILFSRLSDKIQVLSDRIATAS